MDRIDESKRITIDIIPLSTNIYIIAGEHVLDLEHNVRRIAEIRGDDVLLDSGEAYNPEFLRKIVIKAGNNTFDLISQQWDIALDLNLFSKENRKKDLRDLFEFEYIYKFHGGSLDKKCNLCGHSYLGAKLQRICENCCSKHLIAMFRGDVINKMRVTIDDIDDFFRLSYMKEIEKFTKEEFINYKGDVYIRKNVVIGMLTSFVNKKLKQIGLSDTDIQAKMKLAFNESRATVTNVGYKYKNFNEFLKDLKNDRNKNP